MSQTIKPRLTECLKQLHLPAVAGNCSQLAAMAANEGWPYDQYLLALCELEMEERKQRKIQRLLAASRLPKEKTWANFDRTRLPSSVLRRFEALLKGEFLDRAENVLAFGNPGSGKTHLLSALA
jgi:DNA replication protein DnaC